jgi:hypothetical protein
MPTVLILGAGAVRAAGSKSNKWKPPLDADYFDIAQGHDRTLYEDVVKYLVQIFGEYSQSVIKSLEATTTYLYLKAIDSEHGSISQTAFINHLNLLQKVLIRTTNIIPVGPTSTLYRLLLHEIQLLPDPNDLTIITFNYDLVVERVLYEVSRHGNRDYFHFPGCYRLPGRPRITNVKERESFPNRDRSHAGIGILKLHGSMNWQSTHTSAVPTPKSLFNIKRELTILDAQSFSHSLTWKRGQRTVYMYPIIIPPISGKRGMMHQALEPIWVEAEKALRRASRIVIVGYSCPPLDLESRMLLSSNIRGDNKELVIVDPDAETASRFLEICGVNDAHTYLSLKALHDSRNG